MKIVILGDAANPHTQRWTHYLANKSYDVHIISFQSGEIERVTVHHITTPSFLEISPVAPLRVKFGYLLCLWSTRKLIYSLRPDVLHAHWATSYGLVGAFSGYHPFVISTWGRDITDSPHQSWILKKTLEYNLSKADIITATSQMLANETAKYEYSGKRIYHIPFGVDITLFKPSSKIKRDGLICIGTVKGLEEKYGIEFLIRAFANINLIVPETKLLIVGDGSLRDRLLHLVEELGVSSSVEFTGRIPNKNVISYLHQMDIFVVPSISESETFGVSAVEASACAIPIVASKIGGLPEVVIDNKTGYLVTPKNVKALTKQILKLVKDPVLRIRLGNAGRRFVLSNYTLKQCGEQIERIYHMLVGKDTF